MKCPRDGTELAKVEIMGIELDKCHRCDGIWFDRGELERLRDSGIEGMEEVLERKYGDPEFTDGAVDAHMRCPRCVDKPLFQQHYTYINPVAVDRCNTCMGMWLDDGELNAIIGEKKSIDAIVPDDAGRLKKFLGAMARLMKRE